MSFGAGTLLAAQTPSADLRTILFKHVGPDGIETVDSRILEPGEGLLVAQAGDKTVSTQVIRPSGDRLVIIKLKGRSLAQQFKHGLRKANFKAAQQEIAQSRETFKGRLSAIENRHRSSKGLMAKATKSLVAREYSYCFNGVAAQLSPDSLAEIRQIPEVEAVYLDQQRQKCDGYGVGQIGAPQVWQQFGATGQGELIAVIDSGIDYTHPDLGGGFGPGFKVQAGIDLANNDDDPIDDNGHGTHVAGIAAANGQIKGVAPEAHLLAVKVLAASGFGMDSDIIAGIEWAVANGADIINLSLGGAGTPDDPLSQAVDQATAAGVLVVTAAGNNYGYETIGSPAVARTALAVGADDQYLQMGWFSSRGPAPITFQIKPEVVAPGVGILSTVPKSGTEISDPSGYALLDGTSMAAPHVAGAAALLHQMHPDWAPEQLKSALITGARDIGQDVMTQGSGELNVYTSASLPVVASGGELSLGWDDLRNPSFAVDQALTFTNTGSSTIQLGLATQFAAPAGMQVAISPSSISLQAGESRTVGFRVNVDNQPRFRS